MGKSDRSTRRYNALLALLVILLFGLAFRLSVARFIPNDDSDDARGYERMANNVLARHVFSDDETEPYAPTLIRLPGYPLFLATIYAIAGPDNNTAVRMVHAAIDTLTCLLVGALAWLWMPDPRRRNLAGLAATAFAAICPFGVIYVATILTETLTTFLMAALALTASLALKSASMRRAVIWWIATGLLTGLAVLVRPDAGLAAAAVGLTLVAAGLISRRIWVAADGTPRTFPARFARVLLFGSIYSLAFVIVLVPWTIRNKRVFGIFQPLSPAHAEMPGEFVSFGYFRWLRTWIDDEKYIETLIWPLDDQTITMDMIPAKAFDSPEEKVRVAALLDQYNHPPPEDTDDSSSPPEDQTPVQPNGGTPAQPPGDTKTLPLPGASPSPAPYGNANTVPKTKGNANANVDSDNANDDNANDDNDNNANDDNGNDQDNAGDDKDSGDDDSGNDADTSGVKQHVEMTPAIDAGFAQLAQERISRNRLRYYVWLPVKRGYALWFGTHSDYWWFGGELFPLEDLDHTAHQQIWLPLFAALTGIFTLAGLLGAFALWWMPAGRKWLLLVFLLTVPRLVFFSTIENPEPRYVVELFAFASILGGIAVAFLFKAKAPVEAEGAKISAAT